MLLGEFRHTLDAKGRVFVPARWRDELQEGVVITKGLEGCLFVLSKERFGELGDRLSQLSINRKTNRDYARIIFSGASEEQLDKQGRVSVAVHLREFAGLERDVIVIGVRDHGEIWDRASWERHLSEIQPQYEEIAEQIEL